MLLLFVVVVADNFATGTYFVGDEVFSRNRPVCFFLLLTVSFRGFIYFLFLFSSISIFIFLFFFESLMYLCSSFTFLLLSPVVFCFITILIISQILLSSMFTPLSYYYRFHCLSHLVIWFISKLQFLLGLQRILNWHMTTTHTHTHRHTSIPLCT